MAQGNNDKSRLKIDPQLSADIDRFPTKEHSVIVVFAKMPGARTLGQLKLKAANASEALGRLTPEQIFALAKRPDVTSVRSRPKYKLL
jgi:hypothetical protein